MWTNSAFVVLGIALGITVSWIWLRLFRGKQTAQFCGHLTDSAKNVEKLSLSLKNAAGSVFDISHQQAESICSLNDSTQSLAAELTNISEKSINSGKLSSNSLDAVIEGELSLSKLVLELKNVSTETQNAKSEILNSLANLSTASQVIKNINQQTGALGDIVFQAKILSFNASVEAARAGEAGKGFAVVADEIGIMARSSGKVAQNIENVLKDGLSSVENILKESRIRTESALEKILTRLEHSSQMSVDSKLVFSKIAKSAQLNQGEAQQVASGVSTANKNIHSIATTLALNVKQLDSIRSKVQFSKNQSEALGKEVETLNQVISDLLFDVTGEKINDLTVEQVRLKLNEFKIIDVRRAEEFNDDLSHIENATLVTLDDDFEKKLEKFDKNAPTLFICRSGGRSSRACRIARASGFKKISNMQGGMLAWRANATAA